MEEVFHFIEIYRAARNEEMEIKARAPPKAAPQSQQSHQEPHHQHWTSCNKATEIDIVTKPARSHPRHYKDGRVILVRQSKPRSYRQLKASVVDHAASHGYVIKSMRRRRVGIRNDNSGTSV